MEIPESECIVSGTLSFVLYLSCLTGLAPLRFEGVQKGWKIRPSKAVHVYGILLITIFVVFAILSLCSALVMEPRSFHMRNTLDRVVGVFTLLLLLPVGVVGALTGYKRMRNLTTYLAQVDKINRELGQYHTQEKTKEWKIMVPVLFMLLFGNFTVFSDFGIFLYRVFQENGHVIWLSLNVFYYIMIALMQLIGIQFCLICCNVLISFRLLNSCLKKILKRVQDNSSVVQYNISGQLISSFKPKNGMIKVDEGFMQNLPRNATATMHRLADLYCSLCDVVRIVSDSHGTLLVQLLMALLLYLILAPYHLIIILFYSPADELYTAIPQASWVLFHASILLIIVEPCHRTHEQMVLSKNLISHLMRYTPSTQNAFGVELQNFYRHLVLNDVLYAPLGMFVLSRGLIMTILGSITTYLVVIVSL